MGEDTDVCDLGTRICKINKSCASLKHLGSEATLKLNVADTYGGSFDLEFTFQDMLEHGNKFGEDYNTCHFTVYDHKMRSSP